MSESLMSLSDLKNIPAEMLPMPVLSDNLRSFLSWGIKVHEQGCYNHFMWMIRPGVLASQNTLFQQESVENYTKKCRLKLWHCKNWTEQDRQRVLDVICRDLEKPWYRRFYDFPAIIGQALFLPFIQTPGLDICSDKGAYLKMIDPEYNLSFPDPEDVNRWLESRPERYEVYGRYVPD